MIYNLFLELEVVELNIKVMKHKAPLTMDAFPPLDEPSNWFIISLFNKVREGSSVSAAKQKNIQKMNEFFWSENQWKRCNKTHWEDFSTLGPRFRELLRVGGGRALAMRSRLGWVDVGLMVDVHS